MSKKLTFILLILTAVGLGLWLAYKNFPISGQLEIKAALGRDRPMISQLGPEVRVKLINDYQAVLESPVYFDLRSMPWFKTASLYLVFQEAGATLEGIGGQVGWGWEYQLQKPEVVNNLGDGWDEARFSFDLKSIYQQKNIRRFLVSIGSAQEDGELRIKSLKIILSR